MSDNIIINPGVGGAIVATDEIAGIQYQRIKLIHGNNGINDGDISNTNPLPVYGPITDNELRSLAVTTIDYAHDKTHEGRFFSGGYYNPALVNNGIFDVLIDMGPDVFHTQATITIQGDSTIEIYEGTIASGGSSIIMTNHNRMSSKTFTGSVYHTPTISSLGNKLSSTAYIPAGTSSGGGSGSSKTGSGASVGFSNEFILAINTKYLFRLTNISGASIRAFIHLEGYQPTI